MATIEDIFPSTAETEFVGDAWLHAGLSGIEWWDKLVATGRTYKQALDCVAAIGRLPLAEQGKTVKEYVADTELAPSLLID